MKNAKISSNFSSLKEYDQLPAKISFLQAFFLVRSYEYIVVNIDQQKIFYLCLAKLFIPYSKAKLISVDILLRRPKHGLLNFCKHWMRIFLLKKVDAFFLYFKNTTAYESIFFLPKNKIHYIPFKVNSWEEIKKQSIVTSEGDYVLCAGRTNRDLQTYLDAMNLLPSIKGVLLLQSKEEMAEHGTNIESLKIPSNVQVAFHDDKKEETFLSFIQKARIVVIPRFADDIASTGISTMYCAMALKRSVIISSGVGAEDILPQQCASIIPSEDFKSLAKQVERLWSGDAERRLQEKNAFQYVSTLEGEERLLRDILSSLQKV